MNNNMILYYDVNTNNVYNEAGFLYGVDRPQAYLANTVNLEIHYVTDTVQDNPAEWTPWTGLSGMGVTASLAFDTDYHHAVAGTLQQVASSGDSQISVTASVDPVMLNLEDTLVFYRSNRTPVAVPYTSFIVGDGFITFNLLEPLGEDFAVDTDVRIPLALLLKVSGEDVDISNAANGVFTFNMYLMSYRILKALDYSDIEGLTGVMEHKVMSDGNTVNTFHIPFFVANMMDYESSAEIPPTSNMLVTTDYVDSKVNAIVAEVSGNIITQYSADGVSWHDAFTVGDIYARRKMDNDIAAWSPAELIVPTVLAVKTVDYQFTTTEGQEATVTFTKAELGISGDTESDVSLWSVSDSGKLRVTDTSYTVMWSATTLTITYQTNWTVGTWNIKLS